MVLGQHIWQGYRRMLAKRLCMPQRRPGDDASFFIPLQNGSKRESRTRLASSMRTWKCGLHQIPHCLHAARHRLAGSEHACALVEQLPVQASSHGQSTQQWPAGQLGPEVARWQSVRACKDTGLICMQSEARRTNVAYNANVSVQ